MADESLLVVSAHAADFVWRAGGVIADHAAKGHKVTVCCLSYGERGESARFWRQGLSLDAIKAARLDEASRAAAVLGGANPVNPTGPGGPGGSGDSGDSARSTVDLRCFDADDYPLVETAELLDRLVRLFRETQPTVVITHTPVDPYNPDHEFASRITCKARVLAQAPGVLPGEGEPLGAPPVFFFEPHQTEMCQFRPDVLVHIGHVWETKRAAMEVMAAQEHLWDYYTDVAKRRGVQAARNSGPNAGHKTAAMAEAFQRLFPQITNELS